jgi:hypothetical protein
VRAILEHNLPFSSANSNEEAHAIDLRSWGYHGNDGNVFHNTTRKGSAFGPSFGEGDTIGCGISVDGTSLFFTKNGELLGTAFSNLQLPQPDSSDGEGGARSKKKQHGGYKLFAVIAADCAIDVMVNHGAAPFVWKPPTGTLPISLEIYNLVSSKDNTISTARKAFSESVESPLATIPNEVLVDILAEVIASPRECLVLSSVCHKWRQLLTHGANGLWQAWAIRRWPTLRHRSQSMVITSWFAFVVRRMGKIAEVSQSSSSVAALHREPPIENCGEWEFMCPLLWSTLQKTEDKSGPILRSVQGERLLLLRTFPFLSDTNLNLAGITSTVAR